MIYDLIIIGADMAGLTAGIYAGRKKISALILTKKLGGQTVLNSGMENYPGFLNIVGAELIIKINEQIKKAGVEIKEDEEVVSIFKNRDVFSVKTSNSDYFAKTIIVATGAVWKKLGVPGENEFLGRGVSVCSVCDTPLYKDKEVAVIGGGNSGLTSAYDLIKYASKIYLVESKAKKEFKGDKAILKKLEQSEKVEFVTEAEVKEIRGGDFVDSVVYRDKNSGETKELRVKGVFVSIGQVPNSLFAKGFLKLNERGEIIVNAETNTTSAAGVFAAGDVTNVKYKQAVIAAGEGAKAALSAYEYLKKSG